MTTMTELVVLEHTDGAGPAAFTEVLDSRSQLVPWRRLDVPGGDPLPDGVDGLAGLIVLGGTMSATEPAAHPWMADELRLLERAVAARIPVLGVCLGAQLLASALGGRVARRERPRVGYVPLERTSAGRQDPVARGWPDGTVALFVHEDEVRDLPAGAEPILRDDDGTPAWRLGSAHAVQFHPEVTGEQLAGWVESGALDHLLAEAGVAGDQLAAEGRRRGPFVVPVGRALLGRWLDGPVRQRLERDPAAE